MKSCFACRWGRIFLFCCVFAFCLPVWAGGPLSARQVLDRTAEVFRQGGGVELAFSLHAAGGSSSGTIRIKGDKFLLETEEAKTWFDGHTQWSYLVAADEVNVSVPSAAELQTINPYAVLSLYKQGYRISMGKTERLKGVPVYEVIMDAVDDRRQPRSVVLFINRDTFCPMGVNVSQRGEKDVVALQVDACRIGQSYPDALFTFNRKEYPTAEVVDLR